MEEEGKRPVFLPFRVYQDRRRSSPYEKFLLGTLIRVFCSQEIET
jgi:hypothetical protein